MKWAIDVHKYLSEITRSALGVVQQFNLKPDSDNALIDQAGRKMVELGIYSDASKAGATIRRALITNLKCYHLIDKDWSLTEFGEAFVSGKLSLQETALQYISTFLYSDDTNEYYPLHFLLKCAKKKFEAGLPFLTANDFAQLCDFSSIDEINDDFVKDSLNSINVRLSDAKRRSVGFDVWSKLLVLSGLFKKEDKDKLFFPNSNLCKWLYNAYDNEIPKPTYGKVITGVLTFLPVPEIKNQSLSVDSPFWGEAKAVEAFLFDSIDNNIIKKYIYHSDSNLFDTIWSTIGIEGLSGFYATFSGYERLIGFKLLSTTNNKLSKLGEILCSIKPPHHNIVLKKKATQKIFYGAPGTGKSYNIKHYVETKDGTPDGEMRDDNNTRITFHPDTDYASFVGCYKPMRGDNPDEIVYKYQPQAFVKAYVKAWEWYLDKDREDKNYYLIIEELNRGNCAQIFGDMFQLLDREYSGYSSYKVDTDSDLQQYLEESFEGTDFSNEDKDSDEELSKGEKMILPPNLSILATMNTSDQSLFPMDSAFKRRWDWHYVKIDADEEKVKDVYFYVGDDKYSWSDFVKAINAYIQGKNESTAKQIGQWFVKCDDDEVDGKPTSISFENFCSKVLFYLFNDAFRDNMEFGHLFHIGREDNYENLFFENLYDESVETREERVRAFLSNLQQDEFVNGITIREEDSPSEINEPKNENE